MPICKNLHLESKFQLKLYIYIFFCFALFVFNVIEFDIFFYCERHQASGNLKGKSKRGEKNIIAVAAFLRSAVESSRVRDGAADEIRRDSIGSHNKHTLALSRG